MKRRRSEIYYTSFIWNIDENRKEIKRFIEEWLKIKREIRKKQKIPI